MPSLHVKVVQCSKRCLGAGEGKHHHKKHGDDNTGGDSGYGGDSTGAQVPLLNSKFEELYMYSMSQC